MQKNAAWQRCFFLGLESCFFSANRKIISSEQEIIFAKKRLLSQDKKHRNFYAKNVNQNQEKTPQKSQSGQFGQSVNRSIEHVLR